MVNIIQRIKNSSRNVKALVAIGVIFVVICLVATSHDTVPEEIKIEVAAVPDAIDYNVDVKPIL